MIKVSVVVPVYNVEKYLEKCLNSLVNQSLKDIEIIVVNDGATDSSQNIIDNFVKEYPNKIKSFIKENGGLSDARNFGIPHCKGEYIGFIDSDDYVDLKMYELLYESAKKNNSDIVTCDYYMEYSNEELKRVKSRDFIDKRDMLIAPKVAAWNKIYRRKFVEENDLIFPKGLIYEDTMFFAKCVPYTNTISYVPEALVYYVQRSGSIANTQGEKTLQIFDIFTGIVDFYRRNGILDEYHDELEYFCARITFGSHLERVCRIQDKKLRGDLAKKSIDKLMIIFPDYKKNRYIKEIKKIRHYFIRMLSIHNIVFYSNLLNLWCNKREYKISRSK